MSNESPLKRRLTELTRGTLIIFSILIGSPQTLVAASQSSDTRADIESIVTSCDPEANHISASIAIANAERGVALLLELVNSNGTAGEQWILLNEFTNEYVAVFDAPLPDGDYTIQITEAVLYPSQEAVMTSKPFPMISNPVSLVGSECEDRAMAATPAPNSRATPTAFEDATPVIAPGGDASPAASPDSQTTNLLEASPGATPVEVATTGTIILTLHNPEGLPIGGACWQLFQDEVLVAEGCDIAGEFGMNGRYGFFGYPAGEYLLVQSLAPEGSTAVEDQMVEIIAGEEHEIVFSVEVTVATPAPASPTLASPVAAPPVAASPAAASPVPASPVPATPAATPQALEPAPSIGTVSNTGDLGLNCRAAPGLDEEIIWILPPGAVVEILGDDVDGWIPIRCNDENGWVGADFLTVGGLATPAPMT